MPLCHAGDVVDQLPPVCDVFEVHAYNWDDETIQPYNFKCGDVEISWYKYLGRGMDIPELTYEELDDMLNECLKSLLN